MASKTFQEIKSEVLARSGGTVALATALGISSPAISQWERIPAERLGQVSWVTGMSFAEIRPDLFEMQATA